MKDIFAFFCLARGLKIQNSMSIQIKLNRIKYERKEVIRSQHHKKESECVSKFPSGQIAIMSYESKMDDEVLSRAIDQARFNKLQADMADIAKKFKDRTARHQVKVRS